MRIERGINPRCVHYYLHAKYKQGATITLKLTSYILR